MNSFNAFARKTAPIKSPTASAACAKLRPETTSDTTSAGSRTSAHARNTASGTPAAVSQKDCGAP